jgi:hypothetical protein
MVRLLRILAISILCIGFLVPISYRVFIYFNYEREDPRIEKIGGPLKNLKSNWDRDKKILTKGADSVTTSKIAQTEESLRDMENQYVKLLENDIRKKEWLLSYGENSIKKIWISFFPPSLILFGLLLIVTQIIKKR